MLNIKRLILALTAAISITAAQAQQGAQILPDELTYNFGTIVEADGFASHTFTIENMGDALLVITHTTASCGCTQPEWAKPPTVPGKTGEVKITHSPKGRPGLFYKTVSIPSNRKEGNYGLTIRGNVAPKPSQPVFAYPYSIGDLKLYTKTILFSSIHSEETLGEKISIKDEGKISAAIHLGKVPHCLNVQVNPATLQPDEVGAITILMDAKVLRRKRRVSIFLSIMIQSIGKKEASGEIQISTNVIDNFNKLSAADKAQAPIAGLSGTLLEFGRLPNKEGIVPLIDGKVSGTFEIANTGKTPSTIYSVTCNGERVNLSGDKKELEPGATAIFKIALRPKEIEAELEALANVVYDDPNGPIRLIKVTARK